MIGFFSSEEKKSLKKVKVSLCGPWINSPIHDNGFYKPFIQDSLTILSTQKILFFSAAREICHCAFSLFKMVLDLALGHFSQAQNDALQCIKLLFSSLSKLLIAFGIGLLHFLRLTSQLVFFMSSSIFFVIISPIIYVVGFIESLFEPSSKHQQIIEANLVLDDFLPSFEKVFNERKELIERYNQIKENINLIVSKKDHNRPLFNQQKIINTDDYRIEYEQFDLLTTLLNSYPSFDPLCGDDSIYLYQFLNDLEEHHSKTKALAERFFKSIDETFLLIDKCDSRCKLEV